jgi:hypothetical protein
MFWDSQFLYNGNIAQNILVIISTPMRTLHNSAHISDKCNPVIKLLHKLVLSDSPAIKRALLS